MRVKPLATGARALLAQLCSFPAIFAGVVGAFVFTLQARPMADQDIGWHLRNAQYLFQTFNPIRHDMFAYTTLGAPWINHEWLAEIPFFLAWRALGDRGLALMTLVLVECILLGVYLLSYRYSRDERAACVVTIAGALLATVSFGPRTLLLGWLLLVAELLILQHVQQGRGPDISQANSNSQPVLWLLPPLFVLWVNLHGSWLIGIVVLVAFILCGSIDIDHERLRNHGWCGRERRQLLIILVSCIAVLFMNPYGWHLVAYPFDLAFRQKLNIGTVEEWQSLDFRSLRARILLIVCGASLVRQFIRQRAWSPFELALVAIGLYSAMSYTRFLFLAAILVMPLLAPDLAFSKRQMDVREGYAKNAVIWVVLALWCCFAYRYRVEPAQAKAETEPSEAVLSYLSWLPPSARVFNDYDWGGLLEWRVPSRLVFVDSRVDIFERSGVFADYLDVVALKDSLNLLDKYRIDYVFFQKDAALVYLLEQSPDWKVVCEDRVAVVLQRVAVQ